MAVVCGRSLGPRYFSGGWLFPLLGVTSWVIPHGRHNQQTAEFAGLAWAVRLVVCLGRDALVLVTDSEVAAAQLVQPKAPTWLRTQHVLLGGLSGRLYMSRVAL